MGMDVPSFERAEYAGSASSPDQCSVCGAMIGGDYYRVNGGMACAGCAQRAAAEIPKSSHTAYVQAILYGIGAAVLGMLAYAGIEIATGWTIGYAAIGVGYLVGKAMKLGSKGLGGRRYQIAAALLTYAAVSVAAIPVALYEYHKHPSTKADSPTAGDKTASQAGSEGGFKPTGLVSAVVVLIGLGLVSPFIAVLEGFGGIIGLIILAVGMRAAWTLTAGLSVDVEGPFASERGVAAATG